MKSTLYNTFTQLTNTAVFSYILWVTLHYISAQLYVRHCAQPGLTGFVMSTFYTSTSYCQGLSWIIYTGSRQVLSMWIAIGTFCMARICIQTTT